MEIRPSNSKRKIMFVLPSLSAGGAERVLITLMNGLDRAKYAPTLINVIPKGTLQDLVAKDVQVLNLGCAGVAFSLPKLYTALRNTKPDIVISTMAHLNFTLMILRPLFPQTKFIVREAITPSYFFHTRPLLAPLLKFLYTRLYKRADLIISPSGIIIDELKNDLSLGNSKHILLYNPVNKDLIETNVQEILQEKRHRDIHFVASGRLHYQKGFDRLIESLTVFKPEFSWSLSILGDGPEKSALQKLIEDKKLQENVFLIGHNHTPWLQYRKADAFLLPSRWEGLPNVALESLACSTPVIAIKEAGGIAEIASLTKNGAVRIADTMKDFVHLMHETKPKSQNHSLLPDDFLESNIDMRFAYILSSLEQKHT